MRVANCPCLHLLIINKQTRKIKYITFSMTGQQIFSPRQLSLWQMQSVKNNVDFLCLLPEAVVTLLNSGISCLFAGLMLQLYQSTQSKMTVIINQIKKNLNLLYLYTPIHTKITFSVFVVFRLVS